MDATDWKLLALIQREARLSFAELGRMLKLSAPAAAERLRRLEDRGVVTGYRAEVSPLALGRSLQVYFRVTVQPKDYSKFKKLMTTLPEIHECHHITGEESFILRAVLASVQSLEPMIEKLTGFGPTVTSVVLSTVVARKDFAQG
jgi:Lrp/AsnC family leucine-responsive transcriptional regulator